MFEVSNHERGTAYGSRIADVTKAMAGKTGTSQVFSITAAERAAVEELHSRAQMAWLRARDLGMVEGEGLPAYTPRMVMNTANASIANGTSF